MTKRESIEQLFRAYGASQADRAAIYVADLEEEGVEPHKRANWTDLEVQVGCTRARKLWKHASLPPIGVILSACYEVREEDQKHRRINEQKRELAIDPDWVREDEIAHCKLIRELYDAGLDYDDPTGEWRPYPARVLSPTDVRCAPMQLRDTQAAVDSLRAGTLRGNQAVARGRRVNRSTQPRDLTYAGKGNAQDWLSELWRHLPTV